MREGNRIQMPAIEIRDAGLSVGGHRILERIRWSVPVGARAAVLGPNGSGKSTLLRLLTGYLHPTAGSLSVLGSRIGAVNLHALRRRIGIVDPSGPFQPVRRSGVLDVVLTGFFGNLTIDFDHPTGRQREAGLAALEQVGLAKHENQRFHTLSTGEQRRALLARALVRRPELLVLDEPTAGLDLLARETLLATIELLTRSAPEMTTLLVTHHLDELLPDVSEVLLLSEGAVSAAGAPRTVLTAENLSRAFGCPVTVGCRNGRWQWSVHPDAWERLTRTE